jgi:glycine/D-amino acid oxidase-like deaminating enzyme
MSRPIDRRALLASLGAVTGLTACAPTAGVTGGAFAFYDRAPPLPPLRPHPDRLFNVTVCLRPFRAAGPRLEVEEVAGKRVVHNYGHGGSGWSLSWGSAAQVAPMAMAGGTTRIAVIGCGALGLTAAITAQRAGASVVIYAKERLHQARSARATGTWSPDSRIALRGEAAPGFETLWEEMTRTSFRMHQTYLGTPGNPVEWTDRYNLFDAAPSFGQGLRGEGPPPHFAEYGGRVRDLVPRAVVLPTGSHPFPVTYVTRNSSVTFNVTSYGDRLIDEFLRGGGRIVMREFNTPSELASLPEPVVINCTGYGARALWKDESIIPVRGQIAWLIPQPEALYGLYYRNTTFLSRRDGIVVQDNGPGDSHGWMDANETPDRAAAEAAVRTLAELYARMRG